MLYGPIVASGFMLQYPIVFGHTYEGARNYFQLELDHKNQSHT